MLRRAGTTRTSFDYIVVGGGSAGCVLAARLSEDSSCEVLLLEAGGRDLNPFILVPAGVKQITARYDWQYEALPDPSRDGIVDRWAAGKVIGGGSSVNSMLWVRGNPRDFDEWAELGSVGWDYASILPYFRRIEDYRESADEARGHSGPMQISAVRVRHVMTDVFVAAGQSAGYSFNRDYNGREQFGVGYAQVNQRRGWRHSTARAYLAPAMRRPNLTVRLSATVDRVTMIGQRAAGVDYYREHTTREHAHARREVVLTAGALATPRLLMLSGIGPENRLRELGIDVIAPRAEVGRNLQEHPLALFLHRVNVRTLNREVNARGVVRHGLDFALRGRGAVTSPASHALLFAPADDGRSEFQVMFGPFGIIGKSPTRGSQADGAVTHDVHAMKLLREFSTTSYACLLHPRARGTVDLSSADPGRPPVIRHELLGNSDDRRALREAARRTREILRQPVFADRVVEEMLPGGAVRTDDDWDGYLRTHTFRGNHPVGTARMGAEQNSVVDPSLHVHGVDGLRVADASVMPTLTSGNTNAPTIMIAERAADLIRADPRSS